MLNVDNFLIVIVEKIWYNADMDLVKIFSEGASAEKFAEFEKILSENNKKFNLTAICDKKEVYIKHFCDSILPESLFPYGAKTVEIGSGGGFPSVPLKIIRPDIDFTLIESTGKKCIHLNEVVDKLGLSGVEIKNIRAEDGARSHLRESFDVCTARAVAKLNTLSEYCLPYVKLGGIFIAYKADVAGEIKESVSAVKILGGEIERLFEYRLPEDGGKRVALVIRKIKKTPEKYPRGQGKERKQPL